MTKKPRPSSMISRRFRGLLPIVIDIETSGLHPEQHAILELAAVTLAFNTNGALCCQNTYSYQVEPFVGAALDAEALNITKIDPSYPLRFAIPERQALHRLFSVIKQLLLQHHCHRAILVGHNAAFDLSFIVAAYHRAHLPHLPLHKFSTLDTATLAAAMFGETVLAKALKAARIPFDTHLAHSAIYDAEKTAELFCTIINNIPYRPRHR